MKFIICLLFLASCGQASSPFKEPEYSVDKDTTISNVIKTPPEKIDSIVVSDAAIYDIYFHNLQIQVYHDFAVPFKKKEKWYISATNIDADDILIDYYNQSYTNRISETTYNKVLDLVRKPQQK